MPVAPSPGISALEVPLKKRNVPRLLTAQEIEGARILLSEYRRAANPVALVSIAVCFFGPPLLSGSDFLAAFPDLVPALYIVMLAAWVNGFTVLIARWKAIQVRRTLSAAQVRCDD